MDRCGRGFHQGDRPEAGLCHGLCRTSAGLRRDLATRSGNERRQHGDLAECEPARRLFLARPGLSPQGRPRPRHRGFFARRRNPIAAPISRAGRASAPRAIMRARSRISTRCCRSLRTTRWPSSSGRLRSRCRSSLQKCKVGPLRRQRPRLRHPRPRRPASRRRQQHRNQTFRWQRSRKEHSRHRRRP